MKLLAHRTEHCVVQRIWPKREPCVLHEQVQHETVQATKVNTQDRSGEHVAE